jgi:hypothetical protein
VGAANVLLRGLSHQTKLISLRLHRYEGLTPAYLP